MNSEEVTEVRAHYAGEAGKAGLVEEALAERANALAYGNDTSDPDARLAALGWVPADTRQAAAEKRAAAAADDDKAAARRPPQGRTAPPRGST